MVRASLAALLLAAAPGYAAEGELGLVFARGTESQETDIVRAVYRRPLAERSWWMPQQLQYGVGVWRVPDLRGKTRRFDLSVTPVWRSEAALGYVEAGIGAYLLSHTINNDSNRLPSSFQFGSHIGAGLRFGARGKVGVALQHLSNAGIKQPNGGIDLYLVTASFEL